MTILERELKKRGISYYRLCQLLKKNPQADTNFVKGVVTGKRSTNFEFLKKICLLATIESRNLLDYNTIKYETVRLIIK